MIRKVERNTNTEWISFSDLIMILLMIFILLLNFYHNDKIKTAEEVAHIKSEIYKALMREFRHDLDRWSAEIDPEDITISFTGYNLVQFEQGRDVIQPKFKEIIHEFFPRYTKLLQKYNNDIKRLRIEGHTSSEWSMYDSEHEKYLKNLDLSQRRAFNVLKYSLETLSSQQELSWVKTKIGSEGLSSSKYLTNSYGLEDKNRSRRTVFKVDVNFTLLADQIFLTRADNYEN
jgi:outer membrane protein OmpA-like peptidoglycan-associated protein